MNTIASYDPDPINDQKHVLDETDHRSKTSRNHHQKCIESKGGILKREGKNLVFANCL